MVRQMSEAEVAAAMEMYERMRGTVEAQRPYQEPWVQRRPTYRETQFLYATVDGVEVYDALEECEEGYDRPKYDEEDYSERRRVACFHRDSNWSDTCQ